MSVGSGNVPWRLWRLATQPKPPSKPTSRRCRAVFADGIPASVRLVLPGEERRGFGNQCFEGIGRPVKDSGESMRKSAWQTMVAWAGSFPEAKQERRRGSCIFGAIKKRKRSSPS